MRVNDLHQRQWGDHSRAVTGVAIAVGIALAYTSVGIRAQETSATAGHGLEEIVVTAERRTQSVQDVPISVSVLSAESLAERGVRNVSDLQQVAPSVAIGTYNRSTFVNIRGVGIAQSAPTSSPGVAFYIDGTLVPHEFTIGNAFYDIDAVEVLRGPQGTLTGQNSTGGAVYIRTPDPKFEEWGGSIDQTIGDYGWSRTIAALNVPIGSTLALRVAGVYEERDSFTDNIGPSPSDPGNIDFRGYRAALAFQPTDALRVNLRYEDYLNDSDHNAIKNRTDAVTSDPYVIEEDGISSLVQDGYRASGEILYDFSALRLRWLTSYQDGYVEDVADGDRTATAAVVPPPARAPNPGRLGYGKTDIETTIHEFNAISRGDGALEWVIGGFYMEDALDINLLGYRNSRVSRDTAPTSIIMTGTDNTSKSVFGQAGYRFSPQWQLSVGARYSDDKQTYDRIASPGGVGVTEATSTQTTGRVALNWNVLEDTMLYATVAKGYKAGGNNLVLTDPAFKPESNVVGEIGAKITTSDGRFRINGDVFYSDYQDIQYAALVNGLPRTQNAASGESYGAELEAFGSFGGFAFNVGVAYLHAEFAEATILQNVITGQNQPVPKGRELPFSPEVTANAGVQYTFDLGGAGALTPRVQYSYTDTQYSSPFQDFSAFPGNQTQMPSRDIVDVRVTYEPAASWRIEAFATNVLDEEYVASQIPDATSTRGGYIYGSPRQYGARVKYQF